VEFGEGAILRYSSAPTLRSQGIEDEDDDENEARRSPSPNRMRKDRFIAYILIGSMAALFAFVGFEMFQVRAEVNGVYPEYSSFRADPKGCRVLFEILSRLGSVQVERFVQPLTDLPASTGKILLLAGVQPGGLSDDQTKPFDNWMTSGGTLVIAFSALQSERNEEDLENSRAESKPLRAEVWKSDDWGIRIFHSKPNLTTRLQSNLFANAFSWAGHLYIDPTKGDWEVLAKAQDLPVVLQRKFGAGKLLLLADSYPLSNVALAAHRNAELISWLFPQHSVVIFDESHFGIVNHPGIMSLARRYGLDGAFVAILSLGLLYLWASRYSLNPASRKRSDTEIVIKGMGGNEIFTNLLRRNLPTKDLCTICLQIWKQKGVSNPVKQARMESLLNSLPPTTSQVERYNQIVKLHQS